MVLPKNEQNPTPPLEDDVVRCNRGHAGGGREARAKLDDDQPNRRSVTLLLRAITPHPKVARACSNDREEDAAPLSIAEFSRSVASTEHRSVTIQSPCPCLPMPAGG